MQQGTNPSGNAGVRSINGSVTSGYMRTADSISGPGECVTTRTPGPGAQIIFAKGPRGAEILYLAAARYAGRSDIPVYTDPIIYGDKHPPMNFGIEYKDDKPVNYIVELAVAGIPKEEISVCIDKNDRSIGIECGPAEKAVTREEAEEKPPNRTQYLSRGIATRAFRKWLIAPERSDLDKVSLGYADGVLKITIPVMETDPNQILLKLQ